jgi:signal transduction histidine kinase
VVVKEAIERAEAIIAETLTFAEEGRVGTQESVDLGTAAADAWDSVGTTDAALQVASTIRLRADRGAFVRILENLIRNSVEHASPGSRSWIHDGVDLGSTDARADGAHDSDDWSIRSDRVRDDRQVVTVVVGAFPSEDTTVGFYVEDDGPGIPPEARSEVFETAYSTSTDGTGFGLAIVEQIAHAHGWSVAVTEGTAGGARFEFTGIDPVADPGTTDELGRASTDIPEEDD